MSASWPAVKMHRSGSLGIAESIHRSMDFRRQPAPGPTNGLGTIFFLRPMNADEHNLDAGQLMPLAMVERVGGLALQEAMGLGLPYKVCFQVAKARATAVAALMNGAGTVPMLTGPANSPGRLAVAV